MNHRNFLLKGLLHALGVVAYTSLIGWIMSNGEKLFGKVATLWAPVAFLLLFIISATVTGLLVLGKPLDLYLNHAQKDAVILFSYTLTWLIIITTIILVGLALIK